MIDQISSETNLDHLSTTSNTQPPLPPLLHGLLTLIADDERPTFIVDSSDSPRITYRNASLIALVADEFALQQWVLTLAIDAVQPVQEDPVTSAGTFAGRNWLSKRMGIGGYTVFYCSVQQEQHYAQNTHDSSNTQDDVDVKAEETFSFCPLLDYSSDKISNWFFDYIRFPCQLPDPWITFLQGYDWEKTALGPMSKWPRDLSRLAIPMLSAPDPRFILWGDDHLCIFNAAAKQITGDKYLVCLGNPLQDAFGPSVVEQDIELLRTSLRHGTSTKEISVEYILTRRGFPEEVYFDIHIAPIPGEDGYLVGAVIECLETTATIAQDRRSSTVTAILDKMAQAKNLDNMWANVVEGFVELPKYISCAAVYARTDDSASYSLRSCAGVETSHLLSSIDADDLPDNFVAACHEARYSQSTTILTQKDGTLPEMLRAPLVNDRGMMTTASIVAIHGKDMSERPLAFLVIGFNPKFHVTSEETLFLRHFRGVISKACSVLALPDEQYRDRELEMLNRDLLERLQITSRQAKKSEETFSAMALNAPFGMYMFSPEGQPIYVNDAWLRLSGFTSMDEFQKEIQGGPFWRNRIPPEDYEYVTQLWENALSSKAPTRNEHRLAIPDTLDESGTGPKYRWLEGLSFPEVNEDGDVVAMQGWLVDITDRKVNESLMTQRLEDALETKRVSERFIDMVSHEIRNPLSAILQLADGILSTTTDTTESTIDAARTIIICAQHQKKIVDDVLVISKLDSNLLILSPDKSEPPALIQKALKMFEAELARARIQASLHIEPSYHESSIDSVMLDESRIMQVIINLLSNAIKFTRSSEARQITVWLAASSEVPTGQEHGIAFAPPRAAKRPSLQKSKSSGQVTATPGESIYLQVAVKDTGVGLAQEDIDCLFHRFSQASPKTYENYGNSDLGLYISKELTELQGGQIGVKSDGLGKGSHFAFYVKTKRCDSPSMTSSLEASVSVKEFPATLDAGEVNVITKSSKSKICHNADAAKPASGLHVLVVEDNAINQKVMAQQLRRIGCTVHVANHGMEALSFSASTDFQRGYTPLSIVLMDIEMPVMDGLTCTRRIRQLEDTGEILRRVPIIAVTANARNQQIADALKAGVDEVVTKPFRIPELLPRMEALVEKRLNRG